MTHGPAPENPYAAPRAPEVCEQPDSEVPGTADAWDRVDVLRTTLAMVHRRFFWLLGGWFIILIEAAAFAVTLYFILGLGGVLVAALISKVLFEPAPADDVLPPPDALMPLLLFYLLLLFVVQFLVLALVIGRGTSLHLQVLSGERPSLTRSMYIGRRYPQLVMAHLPIGGFVSAVLYATLVSAWMVDSVRFTISAIIVNVVVVPTVAAALFSWLGFSYAWMTDPANQGWNFWQASLALTRGRRGRIFRFTVLTIVVITAAELVLMIVMMFTYGQLERLVANDRSAILGDWLRILPALSVGAFLLIMLLPFCMYVTMLYTVYYAKLARRPAYGVLSVARDRGT